MDFPIQRIRFTPERWSIRYPPAAIHAQGTPEALALLDLLPERGLAVVGTRRAQPRAEILVHDTIANLARSRLVVLSGLALGIDACAHEAALDAGLPTIAILGCGLGLQYPEENGALRQRILESGGLVLSEYETDQKPEPHHFLQRNRLIAGFAQATWIVQAPARSGALNTAKWARDEHRDCYASPSFPKDPTMAGTEKLLDDEHAIPLWGAHNLGKTWLELSNAGKTSGTRGRRRGSVEHLSPVDPACPDSACDDPLIYLIKCCTAEAGGISLGDLLDWAMGQGLTPVECFERIQKAQQCGRVTERDGSFAAN